MRKILLIASLSLMIACERKADTDLQKNDEQIRTEYVLPGNTFFPEGIAINYISNVFYTGSVTSGDILEVDIKTGETSLWASGAAQGRTAAAGMKVDNRSRLWVCGGEDGTVSVLNLEGALLKTWDVTALFGGSFVNDCTFDGSHVYFTDSRSHQIYRAYLDEQPSTLERWLMFSDAQIPYVAGATNANGIVHTPDGKYLIMVVSSSGKLYRISKEDRSITEITLNTPVTSGDGLTIEKNKLYVSRNAANEIVQVTLSDDYSSGVVGTGFGTGLMFNTTMAVWGNHLLVVNGQLNKRATNDPTLPFTVKRVALPKD